MSFKTRLDALEGRAADSVPGPCPVCGHDGSDRPRVLVSQVKADGSPIDWKDPDDLPNPTPAELEDCPRCRREVLHVVLTYVNPGERRAAS